MFAQEAVPPLLTSISEGIRISPPGVPPYIFARWHKNADGFPTSRPRVHLNGFRQIVVL